MTNVITATESQLAAFAEELSRQMEINPKILVLTADLVGSSKLDVIEKKLPEQFINVGIAEQNMIGIAAGLAKEGFIPFAYSFSTFTSMRACEQIRTDLFYNQLNVKIVGTHSGISTGPAGPTHFSIEDIGIIRSLPQSIMIIPSDHISAKKTAKLLADYNYPVYVRLDRNPLPRLYSEGTRFEVGKGHILKDGTDIVLFAVGALVHNALDAAYEIERVINKSVAVIDLYSIKPLDTNLVGQYVCRCSHVFTIEEHNIYGGVHSAIAEVMAKEGAGSKLQCIGINDVYPKGGPVQFNRNKLGLSSQGIISEILKSVKK